MDSTIELEMKVAILKGKLGKAGRPNQRKAMERRIRWLSRCIERRKEVG